MSPFKNYSIAQVKNLSVKIYKRLGNNLYVLQNPGIYFILMDLATFGFGMETIQINTHE